MRRSFYIILIGFLTQSFLYSGEDCSISTEGIYTASIDAETDGHIRFYSDGIVIVSTSVKNIKDVKTWFHKDNIAMVLKGKYKKKKCNIRFKVKGETGEQSFEGSIMAGSITVTITDAKTKAQTQRVYKAIPL